MDLDGKTILITGGTGSFGKASSHGSSTSIDPKAIRIYSRDELKQSKFSGRTPTTRGCAI